MKKDELKINIGLNIDAVKQAMRNAEKPQDAHIAIPIINPKDLRIDDEIFGVTLKPITVKPGTKAPKEPSTAVYPSVNAIVVNSLNKGVVDDVITVNGSIDMPMASGRTATLEDIYLPNEEDARAIADVLLDVQLENIEIIEEQIANEKAFLIEQKKNKRL